jgi:hypothetical protein
LSLWRGRGIRLPIWLIEACVCSVEAHPLRPADRRNCPAVDQTEGEGWGQIIQNP